LTEKDAAAGDDVVRTDSAELGARREARDAGIKTPADGEMVVMAEDLIGVGRLQLHARGRRLRLGAVVLAEHRTGRKGVAELNAIQAICRDIT
jgi:hypothetical protein